MSAELGVVGDDGRTVEACRAAAGPYPHLQPLLISSGLSSHCWSGKCRGERREKQKRGGREAEMRPGEVVGQNHRRGTDLQLWVLSCLELEGTLWPLAFKCF